MKKHNERCKECKTKVFELLTNIYGEVHQNYNLNLPSGPDDLEVNEFSKSLNDIFTEIQNYRGFNKFIRAKKLPNVDFFIKNPGFILEFDETQHFTKPREISLANYPNTLKVSFATTKWRNLCDKIDKKDNDPPFRDEQRAWYDTLRDFAPIFLDLKPTKRLFARDFIWCSFDPNNGKDLDSFKSIIEENE
ncbi:MAG: hypothetical protein NTY74_08520 [Ignavibacteriae bacterium]|nr:hypothetical protein [Ignavibacteriota bacterium]